MIVRRTVAAVAWANPIPAAIARVTAARRIIVPLTPIQLAVAARAAAELIYKANNQTATRAEAAPCIAATPVVATA